jgi:hypothetical protein
VGIAPGTVTHKVGVALLLESQLDSTQQFPVAREGKHIKRP